MKEFLKRIKLIDYLTVNLELSKKDFVERLSSIVDEGEAEVFSNSLNIFSSSKNEFIGQVNSDGFKLKRRKRFFDININWAIAKGTLSENGGQLIINAEILGFANSMIFFYVFIIVVYSIGFISLFNSDEKNKLIISLFLLIHGVFMFSIPHLILRGSVKKLKYELEREFFFLTKNN
jgi:hypothetical protein